MNALSILNSNIRQDAQGRYCLNDLHKAAGGENRHRPSLWLNNKQTNALISELLSEQEFLLRNENLEPVVTLSIGSPATFVIEELVYAYAMWISAKFNLIVIRAFKTLMKGEINANAQQLQDLKIQNKRLSRNLALAYSGLCLKNPRWWRILQCKRIGDSNRITALSIGVKSPSTIARALKKMAFFGMLPVDHFQIKAPALEAHHYALDMQVLYLKHESYLDRQQLALF